MARRATFIPYRPKTILNKSKRPDHWFWTRYSAYPYIGCQHGCEFCYCREQKYSPYEDPNDFAYLIKVKENAPDLLRKALGRAPVDPVFTGDYQPAEKKFQLSRRMLEVCLELGFPVFILERSPLVLRDLDLLQEIEANSKAVVAFSILATPGSPGYQRVRQIERLSPPAEKRFKAMARIAEAGIMTGTCFMPALPGLCDDQANLDNIVRWTTDHGGQFVLIGGLTLSDQQRHYFFDVLSQRFPDLHNLYTRLYPAGSYAPAGWRWREVALQVKELCQRAGIRDRMPRPLIPGEKRFVNKRVVESLADKVYDMELLNESQNRIWAYRKAAWAIEDLEQDIRLVYSQMGSKGLESIKNVGPRIAEEVATILDNF
jgi:DNA repair photolyase